MRDCIFGISETSLTVNPDTAMYFSWIPPQVSRGTVPALCCAAGARAVGTLAQRHWETEGPDVCKIHFEMDMLQMNRSGVSLIVLARKPPNKRQRVWR